MALVARTVASAMPSGVATRPPPGVRNVATVNPSPIEPLAPKVGVSYDETANLFREYAERDSHEDRDRGQPSPRLVMPPSSRAFAEIFETNQPVGTGHYRSSGSNAAFFAEFLGKAINLYENNAKIIAGDEEKRGGSLNLNL
jgi:hypothetical protein